MFKGILKNTYLFFNKIKVVHSIPGRLRLSVPALDKVPDQFKKYEKYVTDLIKTNKNIKDVEYSYITSKVLIKYDASKINEKQILEWVDVIWTTLLKNEKKYEKISLEEFEKNIDEIYIKFVKELKNGGLNV